MCYCLWDVSTVRAVGLRDLFDAMEVLIERYVTCSELEESGSL